MQIRNLKGKVVAGILLLFVAICAFLGEHMKLYDTIWWWDVMLHIVSGVAFTMIGFMLVGKLSKNSISPLLAALFAFTFAVTIGVAWEIYEFVMDSIRNTNMQRWVFMPIPENAEWLSSTMAMRGDGLVDTMKDLIVGMASALVTSVIGYFYLKKKVPR